MTTTNNKTGKKLSTNSKEVKEAIKQHISDCVYDYEENQFKTLAEAKKHLSAEFERVAGHANNVKRFPNNQDRFEDYLQGIPFHFEFETYKIQEFLNGLGINPEGKEYDAKKMWNLYSYLIFRELNTKEPEDLFFACMGNGCTVCNRNEEENGDYKIIAHISTDRQIKYYCEVSAKAKKEIERMAKIVKF